MPDSLATLVACCSAWLTLASVIAPPLGSGGGDLLFRAGELLGGIHQLQAEALGPVAQLVALPLGSHGLLTGFIALTLRIVALVSAFVMASWASFRKDAASRMRASLPAACSRAGAVMLSWMAHAATVAAL